MSHSLPSPSLDQSYLDSLIFSEEWNHVLARRRIAIVAGDRKRKAVAISELLDHGARPFTVQDRLPNIDRSLARLNVVKKIHHVSDHDPKMFKRMFRLDKVAFWELFELIKAEITVEHPSKHTIDPLIKLCIALRWLAGGIYVDLAWGFEVPSQHINYYVWQVLIAIDNAVDNIKFPLDDADALIKLEKGFAAISSDLLRGTVAAGDGIVFKMVKPTQEEVDGDVSSFYSRKGYYAFGLQAFVDSKCRFLSISSRCCASTHDSTAYFMTSLSKAIASGRLPSIYHIVLDEAYRCTDQELSPWKGRHLSVEKDSFNYHLSLHRQVVERAFGQLVQRWGIFWRPLKVDVKRLPLLIRVACKLHNICVDRFGASTGVGVHLGGLRNTDHQEGDEALVRYTDGTGLSQGARTDLHTSSTRDNRTQFFKDRGIIRPAHRSMFSRVLRI